MDVRIIYSIIDHVHSITCEGWYFYHVWRALAWSHNFTKWMFEPIKLVLPRHFVDWYLCHDRKVTGSCICIVTGNWPGRVFVSWQESDRSCICIVTGNWPGRVFVSRQESDRVMYLYRDRKVTGRVFVSWQESERSCICIVTGKWPVVYLCHDRKVNGRVFVSWQESDRVVYLCYARKVTGRVFVSWQESERSCICVMTGKWTVVYLCYARKVTGRVRFYGLLF